MVYRVLPEGHRKARQQSRRQQERLSCRKQNQSSQKPVYLLRSLVVTPNSPKARLCMLLELLLAEGSKSLSKLVFSQHKSYITTVTDEFSWMVTQLELDTAQRSAVLYLPNVETRHFFMLG